MGRVGPVHNKDPPSFPWLQKKKEEEDFFIIATERERND